MSVFPTKILLATDGSDDAAHATEVAVELSKKTDSELHVLYVGRDAYSEALLYPEATEPGWAEQEDPALIEELGTQFEQMARRVLDAEVEKVRAAGGAVAQAHLRMGTAAAITELAEELGGAGGGGQPWLGRAQEGLDGERLGLGRPATLTARYWWCVTRNAVGRAAGTLPRPCRVKPL